MAFVGAGRGDRGAGAPSRNRRRVRGLLAAVIVAAFVGSVGVLPGVLPGAEAGASVPPTIGTAEPVRGPVSVEDPAPDAYTASVACPEAGACVAAGRFSDVDGNTRAFVMTMTDGVWGTAAPVTFGAGLENAVPYESLDTVACAAPGECAAGGFFADVDGYVRAFVVTMVGGVWGSADPISFGSGVESATPDARIRAISCAAPGECAGGGFFTDVAGDRPAFVVTMTGGIWGPGEPVTVAGGAESANPLALVNTVSCPSTGECVAGGSFTNVGGDYQSFVVSMTSGSWSPAEPLTYVGGESATPIAGVESVSCAAVGECIAGGAFADVGGDTEAFVAPMTAGTWGVGGPVTYAGGQNAAPDASVDGVACVAAAPGACAAVGRYADPAGDHPAFVRTMSAGTWSDAEPVTFGAGVENANPDARATAVSCPAVGTCVAVGRFSDVSGDPRGFVISMTAGTWGTAEPITFPVGVENTNPSVYVPALSCGAAGACVAGGKFLTPSYGDRAYVVTMTEGTWTPAAPVRILTVGINPDASVTSVACVAVDACAAGGQLAVTAGEENAFVMTRTGDGWGDAQLVAFAPGVGAVVPDDRTTSVACAAPGECVAGGFFLDADGAYPAFVATMTGGVWGAGEPVTFAPGVENATPDAQVDAVTCTAPGACVAGGRFTDGDGDRRAFVATMTGGIWDTAVPLTYVGGENATAYARVNAVSCGASGECVAVGSFTDVAGDLRAFVATMTGGIWGAGVPVTFAPGVEGAAPDARSVSVSCAAPGACVAGGSFRDATGGYQGFAVIMAGGIWGTAAPIAFPVPQSATPDSYLDSLSCTGPGECVAGGSFRDAGGGYQAFVVTMTGGTWGTAAPLTYAGGQQTISDAYVSEVSCARTGACVAVGTYLDPAGDQPAFVLVMQDGRWGTAQPVAFDPGVERAEPGATARSVSCASDGGCAAGGRFVAVDDLHPAFVMPITLPGPDPVPEPTFTG